MIGFVGPNLRFRLTLEKYPIDNTFMITIIYIIDTEGFVFSQ